MPGDLSRRVDALLAAYDEAHGRLVGRLSGASDDEAVRPPDGGGWTAAQVAAHVAAFDRALARIVAGSVAAAQPAPPDFEERPWAEILGTLTSRVEAPPTMHPPSDVGRQSALIALTDAADEVHGAFRALTAERAGLTLTHPRVGTVTLLQVGDWMAAHTIRHNAQMKRVLGR